MEFRIAGAEVHEEAEQLPEVVHVPELHVAERVPV
jgi:hypothetical protein